MAAAGVTTIHTKTCATKDGRRCNCTPGYRAEAYDPVAKKRIYRTWPTERAAKAWRQDMQVKIRSGAARVTDVRTLTDVFLDWHAAASAGTARNRGGDVYKPSVLRAYKGSWDTVLKDALGGARVTEVRTSHVQELVDKMVTRGAAASTVRNAVTALRVLFKWAIRKELATVNPVVGVQLPSGGETRDNIVPPETALLMIQELPTPQDRALWATAFFAGLRRGELAGLRWEDVDLAGREIRVRQGWDPAARRMVLPKSKAGRRELGMPSLLVPFLASLDGVEGLVFPNALPGTHTGLDGKQHPGRPFSEKIVQLDADEAWAAACLPRLTPHECRHTYASVMIAAGVNIGTVKDYMGHSSVTVTMDLYRHLLPGSAVEAMGLLDAYLEKELAE